jgi:hypothetical protein
MSRRTTNEHDLDPAVAADLEALEAALNDAPGADPELTAMVREVRAQAPSMPLALRERLDRDVAAGFPKRRTEAGEASSRWRLSRALPVLAGVAAVGVIAVAVSTSGGGGSSSSTTADLTSSHSAAAGSAAKRPPVLEGFAATESAPAEAAPSKVPESAKALANQRLDDLSSTPRKVERDVDLTLRVGPNQLADTADGVVQVTQSVGGYVQTSSVNARGRKGDASFTLRIPTSRLDAAIAKLSKLGHVAALDQNSQDITSSFTSAGTLLSDARKERAALLHALSKATTEGTISALKAKIADNRTTIARLQARIAGLRRRADLSTVSVSVESRTGAGATAGSDSGGGWSPGDALHDAGRVLSVAAGVAIVSVAALLPVALLALLALLGWRVTRRRSREHALDSA